MLNLILKFLEIIRILIALIIIYLILFLNSSNFDYFLINKINNNELFIKLNNIYYYFIINKNKN